VRKISTTAPLSARIAGNDWRLQPAPAGSSTPWRPLAALVYGLMQMAASGTCAAVLYLVSPFRHNIFFQIFLALLFLPALISAIVEAIRAIKRRRK